MRRDDLVTVAVAGDFGKLRPALVIQADLFDPLPSVTVLPVASTQVDAPLLRISLEPDPSNGLRRRSQIMIDKAVTVKREKVGPVFGRIGAEAQVTVDRCLAVFLGIAR